MFKRIILGLATITLFSAPFTEVNATEKDIAKSIELFSLQELRKEFELMNQKDLGGYILDLSTIEEPIEKDVAIFEETIDVYLEQGYDPTNLNFNRGFYEVMSGEDKVSLKEVVTNSTYNKEVKESLLKGLAENEDVDVKYTSQMFVFFWSCISFITIFILYFLYG